MLHTIVEVEPTSGYRLRLRFSDGSTGVYDCAPLVEAAYRRS